MTTTEIKKWVYKNNPEAILVRIIKGTAIYTAKVDSKFVIFEVPVNDMGDASFFSEMEAKLLLRWLVND